MNFGILRILFFNGAIYNRGTIEFLGQKLIQGLDDTITVMQKLCMNTITWTINNQIQEMLKILTNQFKIQFLHLHITFNSVNINEM